MLEARSVSFAYGNRPVLSEVSLAVAPGDRLAITAPSGFGKTTLCRLLAGYLAPCSGEVLVDGAPLPQKGVCPVQLIGQHPERALDPRLRLRESLAEGERAGGKALAATGGSADVGAGASERLLEALGIRREWLERFPHELSGGEMQRFCIARALLANPRYLVCDEISTMLDAVTQARIWAVLLDEAKRRGLGMVLVTHSAPLEKRLATATFSLEA